MKEGDDSIIENIEYHKENDEIVLSADFNLVIYEDLTTFAIMLNEFFKQNDLKFEVIRK